MEREGVGEEKKEERRVKGGPAIRLVMAIALSITSSKESSAYKSLKNTKNEF